MRVILRTNAYDEQYELVEIIKCPVSDRNKLAIVRKDNGQEVMTGGILCEAHPETIKVLDTMTGKEQWDWLWGLRRQFYVK